MVINAVIMKEIEIIIVEMILLTKRMGVSSREIVEVLIEECGMTNNSWYMKYSLICYMSYIIKYNEKWKSLIMTHL
jgi:hypothetical protein